MWTNCKDIYDFQKFLRKHWTAQDNTDNMEVACCFSMWIHRAFRFTQWILVNVKSCYWDPASIGLIFCNVVLSQLKCVTEMFVKHSVSVWWNLSPTVLTIWIINSHVAGCFFTQSRLRGHVLEGKWHHCIPSISLTAVKAAARSAVPEIVKPFWHWPWQCCLYAFIHWFASFADSTVWINIATLCSAAPYSFSV